ncbi:alpha/beta hydrolase [Hymenobacter latericus]|uniref:alpha/beta hydrolase n=1 Tax=Hymenobacter sp. YIM 151858-1 TaxID=2987688 RepID=UPI00222660FE|nr:dienelactone hydrolase family protein [Hymenobacter sp. YIM 151858-1]UYZ59349.1 alpha/beta hydrolase [Hymenobacter sp. YIM 151858-1]
MPSQRLPHAFILRTVTLHQEVHGVEELTLHTNAGDMPARFHAAGPYASVVLWVGGAGGGLDGPAWGMYPRLAAQLQLHGIASMRLHYRFPNDLEACVYDVLMAVQYLVQQRALGRVALVGHSFGGAVVISAGAVADEVTAVVAMSSQTYGTNLAPRLSPKPLLLLHGTDDEVLPPACSENIFARSGEPKQLLLYPGCRHGLDECRDQVDEDVAAWLTHHLMQPST